VFPINPKSQFIRGETPFPPPAPGNMSRASEDYFLPREFSGPPHPPFPMRNVYSLRDFCKYLLPRTECPLTIPISLKGK
jgi:hypothetical protein